MGYICFQLTCSFRNITENRCQFRTSLTHITPMIHLHVINLGKMSQHFKWTSFNLVVFFVKMLVKFSCFFWVTEMSPWQFVKQYRDFNYFYYRIWQWINIFWIHLAHTIYNCVMAMRKRNRTCISIHWRVISFYIPLWFLVVR